MKIKSIIISFLITIFYLTSGSAQQTQTKYFFFDNNWEITSSTDYAYYRKVEVFPNGNYTNPIVDYYHNGKVQCIINADYFDLKSGKTFLNSGGQNGDIAWYNQNGEMVKYERYANSALMERKEKSTEEEWFTTENINNALQIATTAWQLYKFVKGR